MIHCLKSARSRTFLLYTPSLINPHAKKKKFNGVKSGDLGGQAVGPSAYNSSRAINTWQELEYRLDICRAATAAQSEVYGRA